MNEAIAHYTVLEEGVPDGLGRLVRARDTRVGRTVAVRMLRGRDAAASQQFLQDARQAARISHPNVAAIYDVGEWNGAPYIACEFVTGEPLRAAIGGVRMPARRAVDIAAQIADALAEAQAVGIVHADVTVDNVVVTPRGHVKLVNVGITHWSDAADPEASVRAPLADPGADMRALATIFVEMLTGRPPVKGDVLRLGGSPDAGKKLSAIVAKLQAARGPDAAQMAALIAAELRASSASFDDGQDDADTHQFAMSEPRHAFRLAWLVGAGVLAAIGGLLWLAMRSS
jgi:serine/threonine-protein kinase